MSCSQPLHAVRHTSLNRGNGVHGAQDELPHQERARGSVLKAHCSQRVDDGAIILAHVTQDGSHLRCRELPQTKAQERASHASILRVRHQPELMWLGTAPAAQSQPTPQTHAAVMDVGLDRGLHQGERPHPAACGARRDEFVSVERFRHLNSPGVLAS